MRACRACGEPIAADANLKRVYCLDTSCAADFNNRRRREVKRLWALKKYASDPAWRAKQRAKARRERAADPEAARVRRRAWGRENREKLRVSSMDRYNSDPEYRARVQGYARRASKRQRVLRRPEFLAQQAASKAQRRAIEAAALARLTDAERQRVVDLIIARDWFRRLGIEMEIDHWYAFAAGGDHHPDNLSLLLRVDNRAKGDKVPFAEWTPPAKYIDLPAGRMVA